MAIEFLSQAMRRIASENAVVEDLGIGYGGPHGPAEGPVWWQEGNYLLFSDIHGSKRMKWTPDGTISLEGQDITRLPPFRIARLGVGFAPEESEVFGDLTVAENILLPTWTRTTQRRCRCTAASPEQGSTRHNYWSRMRWRRARWISRSASFLAMASRLS